MVEEAYQLAVGPAPLVLGDRDRAEGIGRLGRDGGNGERRRDRARQDQNSWG
jgi:hypothetical protein